MQMTLNQGRPISLDPNLFILEMASQNHKGPRSPMQRFPSFRQAQWRSQGNPGNQKNLSKVTSTSGSATLRTDPPLLPI